jgi:hypothetical protein
LQFIKTKHTKDKELKDYLRKQINFMFIVPSDFIPYDSLIFSTYTENTNVTFDLLSGRSFGVRTVGNATAAVNIITFGPEHIT